MCRTLRTCARHITEQGRVTDGGANLWSAIVRVVARDPASASFFRRETGAGDVKGADVNTRACEWQILRCAVCLRVRQQRGRRRVVCGVRTRAVPRVPCAACREGRGTREKRESLRWRKTLVPHMRARIYSSLREDRACKARSRSGTQRGIAAGCHLREC